MKHKIAPLALSIGVLLAGCGGDPFVRLSSGGMPPPGASTGSTIHVQSTSSGSAFGALLAAAILAGSSYLTDLQYQQAGFTRSSAYLYGPLAQDLPYLDPSRRVLEHDCTKPIEDWSANLKCR